MGQGSSGRPSVVEWATLVVVVATGILNFFYNEGYNAKIQQTVVGLNEINREYITSQNELLKETKDTRADIDKLTKSKLELETAISAIHAELLKKDLTVGYPKALKTDAKFENMSSSNIVCKIQLINTDKNLIYIDYSNIKIYSANVKKTPHVAWHSPLQEGKINWKIIFESQCVSDWFSENIKDVSFFLPDIMKQYTRKQSCRSQGNLISAVDKNVPTRESIVLPFENSGYTTLYIEGEIAYRLNTKDGPVLQSTHFSASLFPK